MKFAALAEQLFAHILGGSCAAGCDSCLWTKMPGMMVGWGLSNGAALYYTWRGHVPKFEPMLENCGFST